MELRHLRYFVVLAEELHFGRAAVRLNLTQPPLSQQIQDLERELGTKLFARTSRRVELTPQGQLLLKEARLILGQTDHLRQVMQSSGQEALGMIRIGFVTSAMYSVLVSVLKEFHQRCPKVDIQCQDLTPAQQIVALKNREINVGFLRTSVSDPSIQLYPLTRESLVIALPEDHSMAHQPKVRLRDLSGESFIFFPRQQSPGVYDQIIATCQKAGFSPLLTQEGNEMQSLLGLVAAGLGISLVPSSLQNLRRSGIVYRPLTQATAQIELCLGIRRETLSPAVQDFVDVAIEIARTAAPDHPAAGA